MNAFFCASPYQVFLALNMINEMDIKNVDIYIRNDFEKSEELVERLKSSNIFDNVYYLKEKCVIKKNTKFLKYIKIIYIYIKAKLISLKYLNNKSNTYTDIYLTSHDALMHFLINKLIRYNSQLKIHLYEDGIGNYTAKDFNRYIDIAKWKKIIYSILGCKDQRVYVKDLYLVTPNMVVGEILVPLKKLPIVNNNNKVFINKVNNIFGYKQDEIKEKYIFLEQGNETVESQLKFINEFLLKYIKKEELLIKTHPRRDPSNFKMFNTYKDTGVPWEVICMNNKMSNKIIVSIFSTAAISPVVLYNQNIKIIYLYDLIEFFKGTNPDFNMKNINHKFKDIFNFDDNLFIPKSIDELKQSGIINDKCNCI